MTLSISWVVHMHLWFWVTAANTNIQVGVLAFSLLPRICFAFLRFFLSAVSPAHA